ncbi:MAG: tetratricopeptide repeat protein [Cardiobacteriaceae bacterium]|nr:tetratricopeptide repeat protein [Cardiobacteriaceae bacterium]
MSDRTDEETLELIREWLQQYGLTIIVGIVFGLGAIGGYRYWQNQKMVQRNTASAQLETVLEALEHDNLQAATATYDLLLKEGGEIAEMAAINMAPAYAKAGKNDEAQSTLKIAIASKDDLLAQNARWQLASLSVERGSYDEALQYIEQLQNSVYAAQAATLQGYVYEKQGKLTEALQAYQQSQQLMPSSATMLQINALQAQQAVKEGNA